MAEAPAPVLPEVEGEKKPGRGRPKDDQAPPKPKNAFQKVTGEARKRIKEENPALAMDLKGMADALKAAWEQTPEAEKDRLNQEYEKEMEIWKPKWAAYKETDHYKKFFEVKQDWIDLKTKKKLIKSHTKGKIQEGAMVRVGANFEHAYPEEEGTSKNYSLKMGQKGKVVAVGIGELGSCEIEWEDGKKLLFLKKYFGKLEDPDIPKRPKSGYMLFAGEMREQAQKEVMEAGGGMGDIGKKVSDWWNETSEAKKAEYGERSARMKEAYDKQFLVYKSTDKFKQFENKKVNLESNQKLKKLQRTTMNEAPKKAPSSFNLWKKDAMPKLLEENKQKGITLQMGEIGKKMGELWKEVSQAEKNEYEKQAAAMKVKWEAEQLNFKKKSKYMKFLEERQKVKIRQNRLVNLREMPKKPKSVFALYAAEHKNEVPQGKGEGKGNSALKQKFASASEEEKAKLAQAAKEAEEKWKAELEQFKEGDQFKTFRTTENKVKREFMTEAMKVMTLKFINAAPAQPPKTPFAVYIGEKRKASGEGDGAPKNKDAKKEEVNRYKGDWDKLSKDVKDEYETKRKERIQTWKEDVKAFMEQETWQEYLKEARRLKMPVKQLLSDKKKTIQKLKNGMRFVPLPDKPETIPQRPPGAYKLFVREKKKDISDPEKIEAMWKGLDEDGKKKYLEEAESLQQQYLQDVKDFKTSSEGKAYLRSTSMALRSRRVIKAKFTYLKDMPKKPEGALKTYIDRETKKVKKANPDLKGFEIKKKLTDQWLAMSPEEREPLENEAKEKFDKYNQEMEEFKQSDNWKHYSKAVKTKGSAKAKVKKPSKGEKTLRAPVQPQEMPKKPRTALQEFGQEEENAGLDAESLQAAFDKLDNERRGELEAQAKEAADKYKEELAEFNKSEKGMLYNRSLATYEKNKKAADMKARLAKAAPTMPDKPAGMPEKPQNAFRTFCKSQVGSGKDLGALHKAFAQLDQEEREQLEAQAREAEEKYKADLDAFNKTEAGKKYTRAMAVYEKRKRLGEAKAKFLGNMPKRPEIAFKFFINDRREQVMRENPDLKGLGAVMGKLSAIYKDLSEEEKEVYMKKEHEARELYEKQMKEFESSADYKKYKVVENKVSGKKEKDKAKAKGKPSGPPPPVPPPDMPKKPPMAFFLFKTETRGTPKEVHEKWLNLKAEGQEEWNKKAKELADQYDKDMKAFAKTAEGKKYNRLKAAFDKKQAEKKAKERYLGGANVPEEPKRPMSAYFLFVNGKREEVMKEHGISKFAEVSAKVTEMWNKATKEDKEEYEKKAEELKKEYEKAMAAYKSSDAVKKFERAMNALKKPKGKPGKPQPKVGAKAAKGGGKGGAAAAKANSSGSDSDVMGSDSSNSSSSDSDSD